MKSLCLAICALALSCAGQNIEDVLQEALSQIVSFDQDGWSLLALPYAKVELKYDSELKVEYSALGSVSKNQIIVRWEEPEQNVMTAVTTHEGTVENLGELAYVFGYGFASNGNRFLWGLRETINFNTLSYDWDMNLRNDGAVSTSVGKIFIKNLDLVNLAVAVKYEEDVDFKRNAPFCNYMAFTGYACPQKGNFNLELAAEAAECQHPRLACAASLSAVGSAVGNPINFSLNYLARTTRGNLVNQLSVQNQNQNVVAVRARTPANSPVTHVLFKVDSNGGFQPIATLPNLRNLANIQRAFDQLAENFYVVVYQFVDRLPITALWFDKFAREAIKDGELNCGNFVKVTGAQFTILDDAFKAGFVCPNYGLVNGNNFQEFSKKFCDAIELNIEQGAQELGAIAGEFRGHLNRITSDQFAGTISFGNRLNYHDTYRLI